MPFIGPYRPLWVGMGQLALGLTIVVLASFYVRKRIGQKPWRHAPLRLVPGLPGGHGPRAHGGHGQRRPWAFAGYVAAIAAVAFLLAYRIVMAMAARRASATAGS